MELRDRITSFLQLSNILVDPFTLLEEPIRYEVFSADRLERHARELAARQHVAVPSRKRCRILSRLHENERVLLASYHAMSASVGAGRPLTPAAEWLFDNFEVVARYLRHLRDHPPSGCYRTLPILSEGAFKAFPRIYQLMWTYVAHTDSRYEPETLSRFIDAYRNVRQLDSGELQATPISLLIVLIENLRRSAVRIVRAQLLRADADRLADHLQNAGPEKLRGIVDSPPQVAFMVRLIQRLRAQGGDQADAVEWLRQHLATHGTSPYELVQMEHGLQSLAHTTMLNIIASISLISALNPWLCPPVAQRNIREGKTGKIRQEEQPALLRFHAINHGYPAAHLLSNGRYAVTITADGSGSSRWRQFAVTRGHGNASGERCGSYIFLRDRRSGAPWSATPCPAGTDAGYQDSIFTEEGVRIAQKGHAISTVLEVVLSPVDDVELRRICLSNHGSTMRDIEITSYSELALVPLNAADSPNAPIRAEYRPEIRGLVAGRRPRSAGDSPVWAAHVVAGQGIAAGDIEYETDRTRFPGRRQGIRHLASVMEGSPLSNEDGLVLEPVFCLRVRVRVAPGADVTITFSTMAGASRNEVVMLAGKYADPAAFEHTSAIARTYARVMLDHLGMESGEAALARHLANRLVYASKRPVSGDPGFGDLQGDTLLRHGISEDNPIILMRIGEPGHQDMLRQLLRAHAYWRMKLLDVDLVILNETVTFQARALQNSLERAVAAHLALGSTLPQGGGRILVLQADLLSAAEINQLQHAAGVVLNAFDGSLADQITRIRRRELCISSRYASSGTASLPRESVGIIRKKTVKHAADILMAHHSP